MFRSRTLLSLLFFSMVGCSFRSSAAVYSTPEDALSDLRVAVEERSIKSADRIFGDEGDYILHTGDPVLDKKRGTKFVELFNEKHQLEKRDDNTYILLMGKRDWPFPVPLTQGKNGWSFDGDAGRDEIVTRTVGSNELAAIRASHNIYFAQRLYAAYDRNGDGVKEYASKLISSPGTKDGLYWPVEEEDGEESPLGPGVAKAADENYTISTNGDPQPYKGYFYKIFEAQPSEATDSDPLTKPGKYWLIAYPAAWNLSGVMTFATNERGWIYQKDFGGDEVLSKLALSQISDSWTRLE